MSEYVYVWEFLVRPERAEAFERAYGPQGEWVALFKRSPGYISTLLLKDKARQDRYLTIDRWRSEDDCQQFRARYEAEYRALDQGFEGLTQQEQLLGCFEA